MTQPKRCKAKTSRGTQCKNPPITGGTVCRVHGGSAPQVKRAAAERHREHQLREAAARFGVPVDTSPQDALLTEIRRSAGLVEYYRRQVDNLTNIDDQRLVHGLISITDGPTGKTTKIGPKRAEWLDLLGEERDRLTRMSVDAIRAGIEEKRVEAVVQNAQRWGTALRDYIATLDHHQAEQAREFFARRLGDSEE